MKKSFIPGKVWCDTNGKRIQAHGGSVIYLNGRYYWYGENKEFTTGDDNIWTYGIRCYSSKDLYNWKDEGLIIPPSDDLASPLHPSCKNDRPHILYNNKTNKYVCWMKRMHDDGAQTMTVLTSDRFLGGYEIVKSGYRPLDMNAGDFTLVEDSGKGYIIFEKVHSELIVADLTEDYLGVTGVYSSHFPNRVPYTREAPAHFKKNGKHYIITSGTTAYFPNPSQVAVADSLHGDYKVLGNPHAGDSSNTSFHSQISCIFKVEGKENLYIACADRWLPEYMHISYENVESFFHLAAQGRMEEAIALKNSLHLPNTDNTSIADYVWLPLTFDGENVKILWRDEWRWEDY